MNIKRSIITITWVLPLLLFGQDLHYSQFYASPLTTNPAMTGSFDGMARLSANYRLQWDQVTTNSFLYQTPSVSAEINFPESNVALGLVVVNDQSNNKTFNSVEAGGSFAFKINWDRFHLYSGLQAWYSQTYFDFNKIQSAYIQTEPGLLSNNQKFDFNAGLFAVYKYPNETNILYYGFSISHLLQPMDQASNAQQIYKSNLKPVFHIGANFKLQDRWSIVPGLLAAYQAKSTQINLGFSLGFKPQADSKKETNTSILFGLWGRSNETTLQALIPKVGFEIDRLRFAISYDNVINSLSNNVAQINTFELSINYIIKNDRKDYKCFYNPHF